MLVGCEPDGEDAGSCQACDASACGDGQYLAGCGDGNAGACAACDASRCASLLASGLPIDARDEDEHTALHWACDGGFDDVAICLLEGGAMIDAQNCDGQSPLHMACACEQLDVARELISRGADVSLRDADGCVPADLCPSALAEALGLKATPVVS